MEIIKEESEDFRIEAVFSLKQEETEEQTGWFHSQSLTHSFDPVIKMSSSTEMNDVSEECGTSVLIKEVLFDTEPHVDRHVEIT